MVCLQAGSAYRGRHPEGGLHPGGWKTPLGCLSPGGGGLHLGGEGSASRGVGQISPPTRKAGGMHSTGMLSCLTDVFYVQNEL